MSSNHEQTGNSTFAEPIGGVPVFADFAPSLIFSLCFLAVFGIGIFNTFDRSKRTICKLTSLSVSLERSLVMAMRAAAGWRQDVRESVGMTEYQQITLGAGFITMLDEQIYLIVSTLLLATREGMAWDEWWELAQKNPSLMAHRAEEREKYRKWATRCHLVFVCVQSLQITSASFHWTKNQTVVSWVIALRFMGNCMSLFLIASILSMTYRFKEVEAINKLGLRRITTTLSCLLVIPLFRACVSFRKASTLANSPTSAIPAKVTFYIFQILPELLACAITVTTNYREIIDTGPNGDFPRKRLEMGLPARPAWLVALGYILTPWHWPGGITRLVLRWKERRESRNHTGQNLFADDNKEKSLVDMPSVGWRSAPDLSSTRGRSFYSEKTDEMKEKGSIWAETVYTRSGGWSTFGGSYSTSSDSRTSTQNINTSNPLITDVQLWRPRLPSAFSFRRE